MQHKTWRKNHKWFGLIFSFFLLSFCLSGLVLNHRSWFSSIDVSRSLLPEGYQYHTWEKGVLQGTARYQNEQGESLLVLYGLNGMWLTKDKQTDFADFNKGLRQGAENRVIKGVLQMPTQDLFAVTQFDFLRFNTTEKAWIKQPLVVKGEERFSDLTSRGDSLLILTRSHLYIGLPPYTQFKKITFKPATNEDGKVSLFRTIWLLHSGQLFGFIGKLFVDALALVLILLCLTGLCYWFLPKTIKRAKKAGKATKRQVDVFKKSVHWHKKIGAVTIVFTLFLAFTGWALRPPLLIVLGMSRVPAIPGTTLCSDNSWKDHLRMLRFDYEAQDWLLSSSEGMYALTDFEAKPVPVPSAPSISVMGITVFKQQRADRWLIGSFSGLYKWNRQTGEVHDYFTDEPVQERSRMLFNQRSVSGFSEDLVPGQETVIEYKKGSDFAPMPALIRNQPMSLFKLMLEVHTGRIYTFLGKGSFFYITFMGLAILWTLWSGYQLIRKKKKPTQKKSLL